MQSSLQSTHAAREAALPACRTAIRLAGSAIRATHRGDAERASSLRAECAASLRNAQEALTDHPEVAHAGLLFDAEKEYAEAELTAALVALGATAPGAGLAGTGVPSAGELGVSTAAWVNGLTEAASELRRHLLDLLRDGQLDRAASVLASMDDVYELVVAVDFPDAVTGGLRRRADALRAVLERTRSDLTTTTLQHRLQVALEGRG